MLLINDPDFSALNTYARPRNPNLFVALGDSLAASLHLDIGFFRNINPRHPLNWANALSGGRMVPVATNRGNLGVSGERTDQVMTRVPAVIASGAGTVWLCVGTNDIAQQYPSAGTVVATTFANIVSMVDSLVAAGCQVILEMVVGAASYSATLIGQLNELNQRLVEFAYTRNRVYLHDASRMLLNPTNSTSALAFKTNYAYDATHPSSLGGYYWGKSLAALVQQIVPAIPRLGHLNVADAQRQPALSNGLFTTQTGGLTNIGAALTSGAVPGGWTLLRSGSPTVAITYGTDDGTALDPSMGSKVILTCTFTAAGERVTLQQDIATANWSPGDIVDTGVRHRLVSGMANTASVRHQLSHSVDGNLVNYYSMIEPVSTEYGPDEGYTIDHTIGPVVTVSGTTKNHLTHINAVVARAAGTVVVEFSRAVMRKRIAA